MDGIIRVGTIARVDRQKADGTWQEWHVAQWRGEEREFTTYRAAENWLQSWRSVAAHIAALNRENRT